MYFNWKTSDTKSTLIFMGSYNNALNNLWIESHKDCHNQIIFATTDYESSLNIYTVNQIVYRYQLCIDNES